MSIYICTDSSITTPDHFKMILTHSTPMHVVSDHTFSISETKLLLWYPTVNKIPDYQRLCIILGSNIKQTLPYEHGCIVHMPFEKLQQTLYWFFQMEGTQFLKNIQDIPARIKMLEAELRLLKMDFKKDKNN